MRISNAIEAMRLTAELTGVGITFLHARYWPGHNAWSVAQATRGGARVVVASDGSVMFAASGENEASVRTMFAAGCRTDPTRFANLRKRNLAKRQTETGP